MKQIIRFIFLLSIFFVSNLSNAQKLTVYNSYQDYTDKKGDIYDEYDNLSTSFSGYTLKLYKGEEKVKVLCKDIWGFEYGGNLFRIVADKGGFPCMLRSSGKICYYENGTAHINMIRDKSKKGQTIQGGIYYISETINSSIEPLNLFKFKKTHPEIIECLKEKGKTKPRKTFMTSEEVNVFQQELTRECFEEYNKQ